MNLCKYLQQKKCLDILLEYLLFQRYACCCDQLSILSSLPLLPSLLCFALFCFVFFLTGLTVFHVVILVFLFFACLITRGDVLFPNHENFRGSTLECSFLLSNSVTL